MDNSPGRVVWFDIHVSEVERAQRFYSQVFGWQFKQLDNYTFPYWLISTAEGKPIGGMVERMAQPAPEGASPNVVIYLHADNMDACMTDVVAAGGTVVVPPAPIPGDPDAFASIRDTEENIIGVIAPATTVKEIGEPIAQA